MCIILDYLKSARKNYPEEFNKICEKNNVYGVYRVMFESALDEEIKKGEIDGTG